MSLFAAVGLAVAVPRRPAHRRRALGVLACAVHASFYPQAFFSRFPLRAARAGPLPRRPRVAPAGRTRRPPRTGDTRTSRGGSGGRSASAGWTRCPSWLGLARCRSCPRARGSDARDWVVPMATTAVFASAALLHQLSTGIHYVGALPTGRVLAAAGAAAGPRGPGSAVLALALVAAAAALLAARGRRPPAAQRLRAGARVGRSGRLRATVLGVFLARLDRTAWRGTSGGSRRTRLPRVLRAAGRGRRPGPVPSARGRAREARAVALAFFAGPALCYASTRWCSRCSRGRCGVSCRSSSRCSSSWRPRVAGGARRAGGRRRLAAAAFGLSLAVVAGAFLRSTPRLAGTRRAGASTAGRRAGGGASRRDALVSCPDASADLHLELALEYAHGRDVLLLRSRRRRPPTSRSRRGASWLGSSPAGGACGCVLPRPTDLSGRLLRSSTSSAVAEVAVSFTSARFVGADAFPEPPFRSR